MSMTEKTLTTVGVPLSVSGEAGPAPLRNALQLGAARPPGERFSPGGSYDGGR